MEKWLEKLLRIKYRISKIIKKYLHIENSGGVQNFVDTAREIFDRGG